MIVDLVETPPAWETRLVVSAYHGAYDVERVMTQHDYETEGWLMGHCLGTKVAAEWEQAHRVFSIRDDLGVPHATIVCGIVGSLIPQSPYNDCADLGVRAPCAVGGKPLRVLRVWGRGGTLARPEFLRIAKDFYIRAYGATISDMNWWLVEAESRWRGDHDDVYHFQYKLDEKYNPWTCGVWGPDNKLISFSHAEVDREGNMIKAVIR